MVDNITMKFIRETVKSLQDEKRFTHTEGVAEEAYNLGMIFIPSDAERLRLAGYLHDITKCFNVDRQLALCEEYGIEINLENLTPKLLHARTGCEFARRLFGREIVDDEIYSAIMNHTTGRVGMSLFDAIIYLADYIEVNRTFEDCVNLRKYFYDNIENADTSNEKKEVLRKTLVLSFNYTLKDLMKEDRRIDSDTIDARNYFLMTRNCF